MHPTCEPITGGFNAIHFNRSQELVPCARVVPEAAKHAARDHFRTDFVKSMTFEIGEPGPQKAAIEVRDDNGPGLKIDFSVSWNVFRKN